ncbi:MAG: diguanylate cyclase [Pseudomonadales bacterium]|nr:diguanylate cyclase [Pseudomonadales bacterium]
MTQESQDWKEKYLSSLERFERLQNADKERLDILRKGLVRVSLAADGQDADLDEKLAELRTELRSNTDVLELEPKVSSLEALVVALDERRRDEHDALETLIGNSLDGFLKSQLPRQNKSLIKKYQKSLPKLMEGNGNHLEMWTEYAAIQEALVAYISDLESQDGEQKGFFQRLFAGGGDSPDQSQEVDKVSKQEASVEVDSDQAEDDSEPGIIDQVEQLAEQEPVDVADANDDLASLTTIPEDEEEREQLRQRIASVISSLLQQIDLPEENHSKKDSLIQKIESPFAWNDLPDLLEETAELVTTTRVEAQKEFEGFLVSLHERLREIQDFLVTARKGEEQAQLNQEKLDNEVRNELREIRNTVETSDDIDRIKLDIESMVDRIISVVDKFHGDERVRRDEVYEHIESLGKRMEAMESEATELRTSLEATRIQAMKDALTELPNRQAYDEHIEREFSRWKRRNYPLSIAICDIDHFKAINDNLGHLRGDKVLKLVSRELSRRVRSEDFVARYGGEEFVIVMPDTDEPSAVAAVEKVRSCIEECPFNFNNERIPVTASFGVTSFGEGDTIESCFERADKALYEAKNTGRNKVVKSGGMR